MPWVQGYTGEQFFIEHKITILGICGPTCSGKTIISKKLLKILKDKKPYLFSMDMYYKSLPEGTKPEEYDFDSPEAIDLPLLLKNLRSLILWEEFEEPFYDFKTHKRISFKKVKENPEIIIIEGIFLLYFKILRELLHYSVFIEAKREEIIRRRLERDKKLRSSTAKLIEKQLEKFVFPGIEKYIEPYKKFANLILPSALSLNKKVINIISKLF